MGYVAKFWKIVKVDGVETEKSLVNKSTYRASCRKVTIGTAGATEEQLAAIQAALATKDDAHIEAVVAGLVKPATPPATESGTGTTTPGTGTTTPGTGTTTPGTGTTTPDAGTTTPGTGTTTPDAGTTTPDTGTTTPGTGTGTTTPEQPSNPEEGNGDAGSEVPEPGESEESESDSNE